VFIIDQLLKANMESSKEKLHVVQKILDNLLVGWRGAVEAVNKSSNG
jgi:flagellin-specific chaperone FliS